MLVVQGVARDCRHDFSDTFDCVKKKNILNEN